MLKQNTPVLGIHLKYDDIFTPLLDECRKVIASQTMALDEHIGVTLGLALDAIELTVCNEQIDVHQNIKEDIKNRLAKILNINTLKNNKEVIISVLSILLTILLNCSNAKNNKLQIEHYKRIEEQNARLIELQEENAELFRRFIQAIDDIPDNVTDT